MSPRREIFELLAERGEQSPVDYPAVYILLNSAAGGHYEERFEEAEILTELAQMLAAGEIESRNEGGEAADKFIAGVRLRLTARGRSALRQLAP